MSSDQEESRDMEENRQREEVTSKELRTLRSFNLPGNGENIVGESGLRVRLPSAAAATTRYEIARDNISEKLDHLEDPSRGAVQEPQLRVEYRSIKRAEAELIYAAEDFKKASERSGSRAEIDQVDNEVISLQTKLGSFKQACRIELRSKAGSFISGQKSST